MNRTRLLIVTLLSAAALLVVGALVWRTVSGLNSSNGLAAARASRRSTLL